MTKRQAALIHAIVGVLVIPLAWLFAYVALPSPIPIIWEHSEFIPPTVTAGQEVRIAREFTVREEVLITIDRQFVQRNGDQTIIVEVANVRQQYRPGQYKQLRPFVVPCALTPGTWSLENTLSYRDALGRDKVLHPPPIELNVIGGCQ